MSAHQRPVVDQDPLDLTSHELCRELCLLSQAITGAIEQPNEPRLVRIAQDLEGFISSLQTLQGRAERAAEQIRRTR